MITFKNLRITAESNTHLKYGRRWYTKDERVRLHGSSRKHIWIFARKKHHGCYIQNKNRDGQKDIIFTFMDLNKAYVRVGLPREEIS